MSIGEITNETVKQVNYAGGIDNVNQIDIVKNGVTTTVWKKSNPAKFNVTLVRQGTLGKTTNGWAIGRQTGYYYGRRVQNIPTIRDGGSCYLVGGVYEVSLPATVYPLQRSQYDFVGFTTKSVGWKRTQPGFVETPTNAARSPGTAKPMLYHVDSVINAEGDETTTRGDSGAIASGDFLMYPETLNLGYGGEYHGPRLLLAQKYTFTMNQTVQPQQGLEKGAFLYDVRQESWTTIATAQDPTGIELPGAKGNSSTQRVYYNSNIRTSGYNLPEETWNSTEFQAAMQGTYGQAGDNWTHQTPGS